MKSSSIATAIILIGSVGGTSQAQERRLVQAYASLFDNRTSELHPQEQQKASPLGMKAFLTSEEGLALLKASGHPLAQAAIEAFGEPSPMALQRAQAIVRATQNAHDYGQSTTSTTVPCASATGTRFNLEPRAGAVVQNAPAVDFLPNRAGSGDDLIVQTANDFRAVTSSAWK